MTTAARGAIWILTTTLGMAVGGFIFHLPGSFGGLPDWDVTATIFGLLIGFVSGVVVGPAAVGRPAAPSPGRAPTPALDGGRDRDHPRAP